jgi:hypothetical protein
MRIRYAILIGALLLLLLLSIRRTEPFLNEDQSYPTFVAFYNAFQLNWEKAISTSVSFDAPPPAALTDPSQTAPGANAPAASRNELNAYIAAMKGGPFPALTDSFDPKEQNMDRLLRIVPSDPTPYLNALTWMNTQLQKAHDQLAHSLKGTVSGFMDSAMCQQMVQCSQEQKASQEEELQKRLRAFNENVPLQNAFHTNQELVAQSKKIQDDAQSGALLDQMNLPAEDDVKFTLPKGADALSKLKESDPAKYKALEANNKSMFDLKLLTDEINRNLR